MIVFLTIEEIYQKQQNKELTEAELCQWENSRIKWCDAKWENSCYCKEKHEFGKINFKNS